MVTDTAPVTYKRGVRPTVDHAAAAPLQSSVSASGRMNGMVNFPDALGDDPCTVTGIRAIDEPDEGLVELEITVGCSRASPRKDHPVEHP